MANHNTCCVCGKGAGMFKKMVTVADGVICEQCQKKIPSLVWQGLENRNPQQLQTLSAYLDTVNPKLVKMFKATSSYHTLGLDSKNGLLSIFKKGEHPLVLDLALVDEVSFKFDPYLQHSIYWKVGEVTGMTSYTIRSQKLSLDYTFKYLSTGTLSHMQYGEDGTFYIQMHDYNPPSEFYKSVREAMENAKTREPYIAL